MMQLSALVTECYPYGRISVTQSWHKYNRNIKVYNIHIVSQTKLATNVLNYTGTAMNIYNVCLVVIIQTSW